MQEDITGLTTEGRNPRSAEIDQVSTLEMLQIINQEDQTVALAVEKELPQIAQAVDAIAEAFKQGGRLIYLGAGTSGRLGILDASECPPTFGTPPEQVVGLIAGGKTAIFRAVENAEDSREMAVDDLVGLHLTAKDVVVGIAASGRTPYVLGGIDYATQQGCVTVGISCNQGSPLSQKVAIAITPIVGAEVISGSSRLKAGTAQKLILNMLTTGAMIKQGKVFGNLMVDVVATNAKLVERQKNIVMQATGCSREAAEQALNEANGHCKTAIVMLLTHTTAQQAVELLTKNAGFIAQTVSSTR